MVATRDDDDHHHRYHADVAVELSFVDGYASAAAAAGEIRGRCEMSKYPLVKEFN